MYRCKSCGEMLGDRKAARAHVKLVHFRKGKPIALATSDSKYDSSEISSCYERV